MEKKPEDFTTEEKELYNKGRGDALLGILRGILPDHETIWMHYSYMPIELEKFIFMEFRSMKDKVKKQQQMLLSQQEMLNKLAQMQI